jgi:hypothetical protein
MLAQNLQILPANWKQGPAALAKNEERKNLTQYARIT